jgi:hypothetical protein
MIEFLTALPEGGTSAENDDPGDQDLRPLPGEKVVHGESGKGEHLTYAISINTYGQKNKTLNFIELYQKKK